MDIIKFYDEARKANEQKAQDLKVFSRSQKDEAGQTKADIVNEIFKAMASTRFCRARRREPVGNTAELIAP